MSSAAVYSCSLFSVALTGHGDRLFCSSKWNSNCVPPAPPTPAMPSTPTVPLSWPLACCRLWSQSSCGSECHLQWRVSLASSDAAEWLVGTAGNEHVKFNPFPCLNSYPINFKETIKKSSVKWKYRSRIGRWMLSELRMRLCGGRQCRHRIGQDQAKAIVIG